MMSTKYVLLVTGILGILGALFGFFRGAESSQWLITLICGLSLLYGFFQFNNAEKRDGDDQGQLK